MNRFDLYRRIGLVLLTAALGGSGLGAQEVKEGATAAATAEPKPEREIKIFTLANGNAVEYAEIIKTLFSNVNITADPRTNSILAASNDKDRLGVIEAILLRLDESKTDDRVTVPPTVGFTGTSTPDQLWSAIAEHEARAEQLAEQIRKQPETPGNKHPDQVKLRQELDKTLTDALELRFQQEQSQIKQLEERLTRLRAQLQFRKAASGKIVERRARALIEGSTLKWNPVKPDLDSGTPPDADTVMRKSVGGGEEPSSTSSTSVPPRLSEKKIVVSGIYYSGPPNDPDAFPSSRFRRLAGSISGLTINMRSLGKNARKVELQIGRAAGAAGMTAHELRVRARLDAVLNECGVNQIVWSTDLTPAEGIATAPAASDATKAISSGLCSRFAVLTTDVVSLQRKVHELESVYFKVHSGVAELKHALAALAESRRARQAEWNVLLRELSGPLDAKYAEAVSIAEAQKARLEKQAALLSQGVITDQEYKAVAESAASAGAAVAAIEAAWMDFARHVESGNVPSQQPDDYSSFLPAINEPQPDYISEAAEAWLEIVTNLELDFVELKELGLPYRAALRVRDANGQLQAGDLILTLNGRVFGSVDQAVAALRPAIFPGTDELPSSIILSGGLSGELQKARVGRRLGNDILEPSKGTTKEVRLEIRVRTAGTDTTEMKYVHATCVSPSGLAVIPLSAKSIVHDEPIRAFRNFKGTAQIVVADETTGLTLLQLVDSKKAKPLFPWNQCRAGLPARNQRVTVWGGSGTHETSISDLGLELPQPLMVKDAFAIRQSGPPTMLVGSSLYSMDGELLGIFADSLNLNPKQQSEAEGSASTQPADENSKIYHCAIPSVHIQKLLDDYRKSRRAGQAHSRALSFQHDATQIEFAGPDGMEILMDGQPKLVAPARFNFRRDAGHSERFILGFRRMPGVQWSQFAGLLDTYPSNAKSVEFLKHNSVPLTITDEDVQQALEEKTVIKVVYLPDSAGSTPVAETVVMSRQPPGADPIGAIMQRGAILAILQFGRDFNRFGVEAPKLPEESEPGEPGLMPPHQPQTGFGFPPAPLSFHDLAAALAAADRVVADAQDRQKRAEALAASQAIPAEEVTKARRDLEAARRNWRLIKGEYVATLRDLELQIDAAELQVGAAQKELDRYNSLVNAGAVDARMVDESQSKLQQATISLRRLKVRYDFYKEAAEGLTKPDEKEEKDQPKGDALKSSVNPAP